MPEIIINSFSTAICFLIGILTVFYLPYNRKGNFWFGIFLLSLGFALLSKTIFEENLSEKYPNIVPISELSRFIIAPAFYLSTWYYTHLSEISLRKKALHFIPATAFIFLISLPYFLSVENITKVIGEPANNIIGNFMRFAVPLQIIIYWILSYRIVKKHGISILLFSSQKKERDLNWLLGILAGMFFLIAVSVIIKIKENVFLNSVSPYLYLMLIVFMVSSLLRQKEVFFNSKTENEALKNIIYADSSIQPEKSVSRLSDQELSKYKTVLNDLLEKDEVFIDPEINLSSLAHKVGISMNDLSFVINNSYNMNFYSLMNNYRIEKVKEMLAQNQYSHLTILGIAYEAGFTSKSTFNSAFKKATEITPREYMKKYNIKEV